MSRTWLLVAAALSMCPLPALAEGPNPAELKKIADRVVRDAAGVREGDLVLVMAPVRELALAEELTLAAFRLGAPALHLVARPEEARRYYAEVAEKHDAGSAAFRLKLAEIPTVQISIDALESPGLFKDVPSARLVTVGKAFREVGAVGMRRGVRNVGLGNGLFPTEAQARQLGLSQGELSRIFWTALGTDPGAIRSNGERVRAALAAGKELRITHPNGTDLRLGISGRKVFVTDGTLDPAKVQPGTAGNTVWLPAGECFLSPVPDTAEGTVVFDRVAVGDDFIRGFKLTFQKGKLTAHSAKPGPAYALWTERYQAAPAGKENFAFVDIGIHPGAKPPRGKTLDSYIPAGNVTLGIGDDIWAGGSTAVAWETQGFLQGATVEVDGTAIVEKGALAAR